MKKMIQIIILASALSSVGMASGQNAGTNHGGGTVGSDSLDLAILNAAVRCKIVGMDLSDCDPDNAETAARPISQEIRRCEMLNDNLLYCLTTSSDDRVISTMQAYAQGVYEAKNSIREAFQATAPLPTKDKAGYISAWNDCQLVGIAPNDCQ